MVRMTNLISGPPEISPSFLVWFPLINKEVGKLLVDSGCVWHIPLTCVTIIIKPASIGEPDSLLPLHSHPTHGTSGRQYIIEILSIYSWF
jgi:hypothetical protein